jgi:hypothetical protein
MLSAHMSVVALARSFWISLVSSSRVELTSAQAAQRVYSYGSISSPPHGGKRKNPPLFHLSLDSLLTPRWPLPCPHPPSTECQLLLQKQL